SRSTASPPTAAAPRERPPLSLHDALPISMPGRVLAGIGLQAAVIVLFYLITTYMLTLATNVHGFTRGDTLIILLIAATIDLFARSEEHTSELQSRENLVCRLLLEKKKNSG